MATRIGIEDKVLNLLYYTLNGGASQALNTAESIQILIIHMVLFSAVGSRAACLMEKA